jgi:hypothetical protein
VRCWHDLCGRGVHSTQDEMEVMNHHYPVSYGKLILAFILFFWFLFFILWSFSVFGFFLFPYMSFYFLIYLFSFLAFLIFWFFHCRYNQVDKHLKDEALQCIISIELKGNYLPHYDMKLLRRKKMPLIKQRFFFFFFSS